MNKNSKTIWIWKANSGACNACQAMDGEYESKPDQEPPLHPNCDCKLIKKEVPLEDYEKPVKQDVTGRNIDPNETLKNSKYQNHYTHSERVDAITNDKPLKLKVYNNPNVNSQHVWYEKELEGIKTVKKYDNEIKHYAKKHNVDPDLIRATMYIENATGHKLGFNKWADEQGFSDSKLPMNIRPKFWSKWGSEKLDLEKDKENIEASAKLLGKLSKSIEHPTPEKIGTLWNNTSKDTVNDVGARIGRAYREKPWTKDKQIKKMIEEENIADYIRRKPRAFFKQTITSDYEEMFKEIREKK